MLIWQEYVVDAGHSPEFPVNDEVILEIKPMKIDLVEYVKALAKKATHPNSETPDSALKYSQAALNLAHAMVTVNAIKEA